MYNPAGSEAGRVLSVHPQEGSATYHEQLRADDVPWSVEAVDTIDGAIEQYDERVDCVLTHFELADGTACDLVERLSERDYDPPVVTLVSASGDTVPAAALSSAFAETIPITSDAAPVDRVVDAVGQFAPSESGPLVIGQHATSDRSLHEWKANILDQYFTEIPLHMFVKDRDGRHVCVSEAMVGNRIHRSGEPYLGRRDIDGIVPEADAREPFEDDMSVIQSEDPIYEKEEHYESEDRWFRTSKTPWYGTDGTVKGVLGVSEEITAQKERERALRVTSHMLRHNFRNDLTVIDGGARYLLDRLDGEGEAAANRIVRASDRLLEKIDKQQTIVRLLTKRPNCTPLDLQQLVAAETAAASERYPDATIEYHCSDPVTATALPAVRLVVEELIDNAVEHAANEAAEITLRVEQPDDRAVVYVTDNCPPIPDEEIALLSGETPITQLSHGSGLGLWISQWIVTRSSGSIDFETASDGGNVVTISLPVADGAGNERDRRVNQPENGR